MCLAWQACLCLCFLFLKGKVQLWEFSVIIPSKCRKTLLALSPVRHLNESRQHCLVGSSLSIAMFFLPLASSKPTLNQLFASLDILWESHFNGYLNLRREIARSSSPLWNAVFELCSSGWALLRWQPAKEWEFNDKKTLSRHIASRQNHLDI